MLCSALTGNGTQYTCCRNYIHQVRKVRRTEGLASGFKVCFIALTGQTGQIVCTPAPTAWPSAPKHCCVRVLLLEQACPHSFPVHWLYFDHYVLLLLLLLLLFKHYCTWLESTRSTRTTGSDSCRAANHHNFNYWLMCRLFSPLINQSFSV